MIGPAVFEASAEPRHSRSRSLPTAPSQDRLSLEFQFRTYPAGGWVRGFITRVQEVYLEPVRLGVIGCGVIGSQHIQASLDHDSVDVVAIADLREHVANDIAARHVNPKVYTEGTDLLLDDAIEGVVLAMPACVRMDLALKAFERGIHVLVEKPVGMNADEVRELIAARGELIAGCCCSRFRFRPRPTQ